MRKSIPARTKLLAGQSLRLYADAGLIVVAARGTAGILPSIGYVPAMQVLHDGEAYHIDHAGWITIAAYDDAEIVCTADPPRDDSIWRRLCAFFTPKRARLAGKGA